MKSTGHCLITSSTPFHFVILKTRGRLSTDFFYFLCKTLYSYQNSKLHSTSLVGAEHYPPCFSVAPMIEWTNKHYRTLAHLISKRRVSAQKCLLPKQLSTRLAIWIDSWHMAPEQHPIVLQIGGNNLKNLSKATQLATPYV